MEQRTYRNDMTLKRYRRWLKYEASGVEVIAPGMNVTLGPSLLGDTERSRPVPERYQAEMVLCHDCGAILIDGEACAELSFGAGEVPSGQVRYLGVGYCEVYWRSNHGEPI